MPYPEPLNVSHIAEYVYDFCPLPDPDVGLPVQYVMLRMLLSILVCAAESVF